MRCFDRSSTHTDTHTVCSASECFNIIMLSIRRRDHRKCAMLYGYGIWNVLAWRIDLFCCKIFIFLSLSRLLIVVESFFFSSLMEFFILWIFQTKIMNILLLIRFTVGLLSIIILRYPWTKKIFFSVNLWIVVYIRNLAFFLKARRKGRGGEGGWWFCSALFWQAFEIAQTDLQNAASAPKHKIHKHQSFMVKQIIIWYVKNVRWRRLAKSNDHRL